MLSLLEENLRGKAAQHIRELTDLREQVGPCHVAWRIWHLARLFLSCTTMPVVLL